jgi:Na+-transporting methylmalonyl-CoA/oxaloacetate decarboxylase gamma subunit
MKKKIALMLSMLMLSAFMLGACGTDPAAVDYNGYTYDELYENLDENLQMVQAVSSFLETYELSASDIYDHSNSEIYDYLVYYGVTDEQIAAAASWEEVAGEFGTYTAYDEDSFSVNKAGSTLTTDLTLAFTADDGSTRDVTFEVVYEYYSMEISGISIDPVYSIGEKLSKAGLNTLISISIVFCVLILISLIIYAFNIFPYLENKKKAKAAAAAAAEPKKEEIPAVLVPEVQPNVTDDTELIAVIAAAIAASEGTSTGDFVVRSINRR